MRTKHALTIAAILFLPLALLAATLALDINRHRDFVQSALAERLGRDVTLGRMTLSVMPPAIRVHGAVIGEDPAFGSERPFVKAEELAIALRPFPLLRGRFELRSLELRRPEIELIHSADGGWNFTSLGGPRPNDSGTLALDRLEIAGGQVAVSNLESCVGASASDEAAEPGRAVYRNIDLQLRGYRTDRPFNLVLAVTLPDGGAQRLGLRGNAGPIVQDDLASTPFDGSIELDRVSWSGLRQFLEAGAFADADAIVTGKAQLKNRDGRLASTGGLRFEQPRIRGVALGYPVGLDFDVTRATATGPLTIRSGTLRLDRTPLAFDGTIDLQPETPMLDLHVAAPDVPLAEAARLASAFGVAFGAGTTVQGRLSADVRARGVARQPAFDGQLRLRGVTISGADIPRPVRTEAVDLSLTPNAIRSNDFSASTNGTSLAVTFALEKYTTARPSIDAHVRTVGANLGEILNVARAWGVRAASGTSGSGHLTFDLRAAGSTDDPALSGSGSLDEATLKLPSVAQPLRIHHANLTFSSNAASAENLKMTIGRTSAEGRVAVRSFTTPKLDFQLAADRVDAADLQNMFAPGTPPRQAGAKPDGDTLLRRATGAGVLRVGSMTYDQLLLEDVQATASLDRGLIRLEPLTARIYGGRHRGSIVIDARRSPSGFSVSSDLEQVDANRLATAVADMRDTIYGALTSAVRVKFSTDGDHGMAKSLNGTLALNVPNGRIANMDVMAEIANIAQFVGGRRAALASTPVAALSGTFKVVDGVAHTTDLTATIEGGRIGARGSIDLVRQAIDLRLNAVLSRDFSRRVGGSSVGGFMGTVLANRRGELVVPMLVTGTLRQPLFAPDLQRLAEMKMRNLLPSLLDPHERGGAILGIGQEPTTPAAPRADQKDPAVRQIEDALKKLLGGAKPEKKPPPR